MTFFPCQSTGVAERHISLPDLYRKIPVQKVRLTQPTPQSAPYSRTGSGSRISLAQELISIYCACSLGFFLPTRLISLYRLLPSSGSRGFCALRQAQRRKWFSMKSKSWRGLMSEGRSSRRVPGKMKAIRASAPCSL